MILAKYYTPEEGGHWTPFPFEFEKGAFDNPQPNNTIENQKFVHVARCDNEIIKCASIMFSDGSIYDAHCGKYRHERAPEYSKELTIDYMNTTLKDIYG